jgi:lipopolysaccharide transport system permease protein
MFATPVVYPASLVPESWRWLFFLNPMAGLIEGFRSAFLGRPFDVLALLFSLGVSLVLFFIGVAYFEKAERRFADII